MASSTVVASMQKTSMVRTALSANRNSSLRFRAVISFRLNTGDEDCEYKPTVVDKQRGLMLPEFFTEEIFFDNSQTPMFMAKVMAFETDLNPITELCHPAPFGRARQPG